MFQGDVDSVAVFIIIIHERVHASMFALLYLSLHTVTRHSCAFPRHRLHRIIPFSFNSRGAYVRIIIASCGTLLESYWICRSANKKFRSQAWCSLHNCSIGSRAFADIAAKVEFAECVNDC